MIVFKKHEIDIPKEAMHAVMYRYPGAAQKFIENIYILLTQKSLPKRDAAVIESKNRRMKNRSSIIWHPLQRI